MGKKVVTPIEGKKKLLGTSTPDNSSASELTRPEIAEKKNSIFRN